jgi:hypothetical protein
MNAESMKRKTKNKLKTISFRTTVDINNKLKNEAVKNKRNASQMIHLALERCFLEGRWAAALGSSQSSDREKELHKAFCEFCNSFSTLAFAVKDAKDEPGWQLAVKASDVLMEKIQKTRELLSVR